MRNATQQIRLRERRHKCKAPNAAEQGNAADAAHRLASLAGARRG
jgi:hypothetical protein